MGPVATINVRLPLELKERGSAVLERNSTSITDLVRELYSYMEREQRIPDCLLPSSDEDTYEKRRRLLRQSVGILSSGQSIDVDSIRQERIEKKYGEFL